MNIVPQPPPIIIYRAWRSLCTVHRGIRREGPPRGPTLDKMGMGRTLRGQSRGQREKGGALARGWGGRTNDKLPGLRSRRFKVESDS